MAKVNEVKFFGAEWEGKKLSNKNQYTLGNDRPIPESAYVASSYMDGIYQQFDEEGAPNGWASIQDTFKMVLPQSAWEIDDKIAEVASGFIDGAIFADDYNMAKSVQVDEAFNLPESGRSTYVDGIDTKFGE